MTVTVPRTRMHRSKTLSLAAPRAPSFTTLPTELILDILERALLASPKTGHAYARINKHIAHLFDQILYRTVVLASSRQIALFARTLASKPPSFLPAHVKRLAITWDTPTTLPATTHAHLTTIIHACAGTRALAVPQELMSICLEACPPAHHPAAHDYPAPMPADITIGAFTDMAPLFPLRTEKQALTSSTSAPPLFAGVTRLRIAEPAGTWTAPRAMLAQLGPLAQLTHLHLARARARMRTTTSRSRRTSPDCSGPGAGVDPVKEIGSAELNH
ncbi:hypothetical protein EWM64_g9642 [Hericium alpestre]|uniref:Uncharacterized protein n=1 Tax=Hericium alpestre TaxID=135208 RepID=A0A4Y9ZLR5_9AGAM|nr:hypothetical protein EWM64_g9642 [Hericium alpestre]